jgi:hypothetical protein
MTADGQLRPTQEIESLERAAATGHPSGAHVPTTLLLGGMIVAHQAQSVARLPT